MLRLFVLLLLLANSVYWIWSEGGLRGFGYGPAQQREPQRMAQQIHPDALQILTAADLQRVEAQVKADLAPRQCLQAGPLDAGQVESLRTLLEAQWAADTWQLNTVAVPARWMVYMGKFAGEEALAKKRGELAAMNLKVHSVETPALQLGLSLGLFESEVLANAELARLAARGIRTARVIAERADEQITLLRLPAVSEAMRPLVDTLTPVLAGKPLVVCP